VDSGYLDHVLRVTPQVEALRATGWDGWLKPWYDVFLPDSALQAHMDMTLPRTTPLDVGEGFVLTFAQQRSRNTSSTYPYPAADGSDWFFLFDILPALPPEAADRARRLVEVNRTFYEHARGLGGTRYPIGAVEFTVEDWKRQYGDRYANLRALKRAHDPAGILAQGVGMF
jgi:cytokinin dehydrogenase